MQRDVLWPGLPDVQPVASRCVSQCTAKSRANKLCFHFVSNKREACFLVGSGFKVTRIQSRQEYARSITCFYFLIPITTAKIRFFLVMPADAGIQFFSGRSCRVSLSPRLPGEPDCDLYKTLGRAIVKRRKRNASPIFRCSAITTSETSCTITMVQSQSRVCSCLTIPAKARGWSIKCRY